MSEAWVWTESHGQRSRSVAMRSTSRGHFPPDGVAAGGSESRDVQRGEVVGLHRAVELPPVDGHHHLVFEPQMVQEHRPRQLDALVVAHGQLHLREQVAGPALRHQEGATLRSPMPARRRWRRPAARRRPGGRCPARPRPGPRRRGPARAVTVDPVVGPQQLDRALGHQRRSGHGVDHGVGRRLEPPPPPAPPRSRRRPRRRSPPPRRGASNDGTSGKAGRGRVARRAQEGPPLGRRQ